jgi:hypothetical protein
MKKKLLSILMCILFVSFVSYINTTKASVFEENYFSIQDTSKTKQKVIKKDTTKPIVIDSAWQMNKKMQYQRLEKSEKNIQSQQKTIDSLMVLKKKK